MKVYVATIDTKYEVMAVATTRAMAGQLVADKAYAYLKECGAIDEDTSTPARVADYFGVRYTEVELDSAVHSGNIA